MSDKQRLERIEELLDMLVAMLAASLGKDVEEVKKKYKTSSMV